MKRKVFTDGNGSKHIFVEGLGEYSPKNDCDRLVEENQRLTAIATKHATRADELYEFVEKVANAKVEIKEISGQFGGIEEISYISDIFADKAKELIEKSRIEAEKGDE